MPDLISVSCHTGLIALRLYLGLVLAGLAVAAHAAQPEGGHLAPRLDLLAAHSTQPDAGWMPPYRFSAGVALTTSTSVAPAELWNSSASPSSSFVKPEKETLWATNNRWQVTPGSDRASLSPLLRFESGKERIEVIPRSSSIWMVWRRAFH